MSKRNLDVTKDAQFEEMLYQNLPDTPPNFIVEAVTPWRSSINRILVGLVLCSVTFQFLGLQYILPTVGMFLLLLGFRGLRNENKYFRACWILTILRVVMYFFGIILNTTIYQMTVTQLPAMKLMAVIGVCILIVTCICFWCALKQIRRETGVSFNTTAAGALIWWYVFILILALLPMSGIVLSLIGVVLFFVILYGIYKQSYALDQAGYALHLTPIKVSNGKLVGILLLILLVGMASGYVFGGKYPMDWQQVDASEHASVEDIKIDLIKKGFPKDILNDLSAEDIAACEGALQVVVEDRSKYQRSGEYGQDYLKITGVGIRLSEEKWKVVHHFRWEANPGFRGTEAIQLHAAHQRRWIDWEWKQVGDYTGRVLCEMGGQTMHSPYYRLGNQTYISNVLFMAGDEITEGFATFSLPWNADHHRGYISYVVEPVAEDSGIFSAVEYVHQKTWMQYPVYTAEEYLKLNFSKQYNPFWVVRENLEFWEEDGTIIVPTYE